MFSFIWSQPIYKTLTQLRIISIIAIVFTGYMLWDMWIWFKDIHPLPEGWTVAFFGFAGAVLAAFWKAINHIQDSIKEDGK